MLVNGKISRETIMMRKTLLRSAKYPERGETASFQTSQLDLAAEGFISSVIQSTEILFLIAEQEQYCPLWDLAALAS